MVMSSVRCAAEDLFAAAAAAAAAQVDKAQAEQALAFLNRTATSARDATGRVVFNGANPSIVRDALISAFSSSGTVDLASLLISLSIRAPHASPTIAAITTAAHLLGNGALSFSAYSAVMRCCAHVSLTGSIKSARLSDEGALIHGPSFVLLCALT